MLETVMKRSSNTSVSFSLVNNLEPIDYPFCLTQAFQGIAFENIKFTPRVSSRFKP